MGSVPEGEMKRIDISEKRFGRLFALKDVVSDGHNRTWLCKCDCGRVTTVAAARLTTGNTTSCGCRKLECSRENGFSNRIHGISKSPIGVSWMAMMSRCYNQNQASFSNYGKRGIKVCDFLRESPVNLKLLIGERPKKLSLDRKDNSLSYTCGKCSECLRMGWLLNVRWATRMEQNRNRRDSIYLTIGGVRRHIKEWAVFAGLSDSAIRHRIKSGLTGFELIKKSK